MVATGEKIVSNIFYYFLDFLTVTVAGYIFWVLMGKMLAPEQYGVLTAVLAAFYVLSTLTTAGLNEVLPRFIPQWTAAGKPAAVGGLIRWALRIGLALGLVSFAVLAAVAGPLAAAFGKPILLFYMLAAMLLTATVATIAKAVLQGLQNFRAMFAVDLAGNIVRLSAAVLFVLAGWAAAGGVAAWVLFFVIIAAACVAITLLQKFPAGPFELKTVLSYAGTSTASLFAYYLILQGGVLVAAAMLSAEAVAWLGVAVLFGQVLLFVPYVLAGAILPNLAELWISSRQKMEQLLAAVLKATILSTLPFTILFAVGAPLLISIIYTPAYAQASVLFPTFMLGAFLFGIAMLAMTALYAVGRPRARLIVAATGALVNIAACILLIPVLGVAGAALAFLTSQIAVIVLALAFLGRAVQLTFSKRGLLAFPAAGLFGAILWLHTLAAATWLKAIVAVAALVTYAITLFATRVITDADLLLLDYFPDRFGLAALKRAVRRFTELFRPRTVSAEPA